MVFRLFSIEERKDMIEIYFRNNKSATAALREYMRQYPNRRRPSKLMFTRLAKKLSETASLLNVQKKRKCSVLSEETKTTILAYYEYRPVSSINQVVRETGISHGSIQKVLKEYKYKPFKFRNSHKLNAEQCRKRLNFCVNFLAGYRENNDLLKNILWTDESSFSTRRGGNRQNTRYWSIENPRQIREIKHQGYQAVNVWCGMIDRHILGPIFIEGKLTGERYLQLLQHEIEQCIDELPLNIAARIIWQQDGAPPHSRADVRNFLNMEYPEGWIGNGGTISWPANSPDLTVMDFFFWGHIKNVIYQTPCYEIEEIKERISNVIQEMRQTPEILVNAINHSLVIYEKCIEKNGGHVEQYL